MMEMMAKMLPSGKQDILKDMMDENLPQYNKDYISEYPNTLPALKKFLDDSYNNAKYLPM
jgi:hypothetical protein